MQPPPPHQGLLSGGAKVRSKIDRQRRRLDWLYADGVDGFLERYADLQLALPKSTYLE